MIQGFWKLTIIWSVPDYLSMYIHHVVMLLNLIFHFLVLKGNALKDVGRINEAIQCYNVGS